MGEARFIDPEKGDIRMTWDPDSREEVDAVKAQFDKLKAKGFQAFEVDPKDHGKGGIMQKFNPNAARIIMAPLIQGG
jgi:hypothetical protein